MDPNDEVCHEDLNDKTEETANKFCVDVAKSGIAKCRKCNKQIDKNLVRIGKYVVFKGKIITHFFHTACAFASFKKARRLDNVVKDISELDGVESITDEDRKFLVSAIKKGNEERSQKFGRYVMQASQKTIKQITPAARSKKKLVVHREPAIRIMFANVDQLTSSKKDELLICIQNEKPMIVAITEAKPKNSTKDRSIMDYELENYSLHPINLQNCDPGRGIAVYTHKSLEKSIADITTEVKFEECCLTEIRLRGGDLMLFACCYRSPTQSQTSEVNNERLNQLLDFIAKKYYSHRCIVGDFNYKDINWTSWTTPHGAESKEQKFIDTIRNCYFYQHIQQETRRRGRDAGF